jgi:hypothetical protein
MAYSTTRWEITAFDLLTIPVQAALTPLGHCRSATAANFRSENPEQSYCSASSSGISCFRSPEWRSPRRRFRSRKSSQHVRCTLPPQHIRPVEHVRSSTAWRFRFATAEGPGKEDTVGHDHSADWRKCAGLPRCHRFTAPLPPLISALPGQRGPHQAWRGHTALKFNTKAVPRTVLWIRILLVGLVLSGCGIKNVRIQSRI